MENLLKQLIKKVHSFRLTKIVWKRKKEMTTVDFINVRGQQNFDGESVINLIELKIENDKIQKCSKNKKNSVKFNLEGLLFSSTIKNVKEKIFVMVSRLSDAKYSLINGKLHQTIGVTNLSETEIWSKIKKSS